MTDPIPEDWTYDDYTRGWCECDTDNDDCKCPCHLREGNEMEGT